MQLYQAKNAKFSILSLDIFKLLGIELLDQKSKDNFITKVTSLINEYFLQEKLGENLTRTQIQTLITKYPPVNEKNVQAFLEEVSTILPNASDMYMEATAEVKARLVVDQYKTMIESIERQIAEIKDSGVEKQILEEEAARAKINLQFAQEERWEMINAF